MLDISSPHQYKLLHSNFNHVPWDVNLAHYSINNLQNQNGTSLYGTHLKTLVTHDLNSVLKTRVCVSGKHGSRANIFITKQQNSSCDVDTKTTTNICIIKKKLRKLDPRYTNYDWEHYLIAFILKYNIHCPGSESYIWHSLQ